MAIMNTYKITLRECGETETVFFKGFDRDHAIERLYDSLDNDCAGMEILSATRVKPNKN